MSIRESLYSVLVNDASVGAYVGTRVYPDKAPVNATLPYIVTQKVGDVNEHVLDGNTGLSQPRWQITAWATSREQADALATAAKAALDTKSGAIEGSIWDWCKVEDRRDVFASRADGSDKIDHGDQLDVILWFRGRHQP